MGTVDTVFTPSLRGTEASVSPSGWLDRLGISPGDRALAWKELRETFPIFVGAMALYLWCLPVGVLQWWAVDGRYGYLPFVRDENTLQFFRPVFIAAAIALALRQTLVESFAGTYTFLLHRPIERVRLFGIKMLVGAGLYLLSGAIVIGGYGVWAATPGTHPGPFEWSMTLPFWRMLVQCGAFYFAAFWGGIHSGRWYGSRWWAAAGTASVVMVLNDLSMRWWCVVLGTWLTCLIIACFATARTRDW